MIIQDGWFRKKIRSGVWHKVKTKSIISTRFKFMCGGDIMGKDEHKELFVLKQIFPSSRLCKNCIKKVKKYCAKIQEDFPS